MSLRQAATRFGMLIGMLAPIACAVEQLELPTQHGDDGGSAGTGGLPPISMAGKPPMTGGNPPTAGTPSTGGHSSAGNGTGGNVSNGGNTNKGGSAGNSTGGSSAGNSTGGSSGGSTSASCTGLPEYKAGDSTQSFKVGDMLQWKGKKYETVQAVPFPNAGCEPDAPAMWCAGWFKAAGDC